MTAEQTNTASGDSAVMRYFLPGLVVGMVLGSMLGLYVGTRSGGVQVPVNPGSATGAAAPSTPDPRTEEPPPTEPAPAEPEEKAPADAEKKPEGTP